MSEDVETPAGMSLRDRAAQALRQARKLPIGKARNDLRQAAMLFLDLDRNGLHADVASLEKRTLH